MGFTVLPYTLATGGSVTDQDMSAVTDPEFSQRNSHYIFTEQYMLLGALYMGANATRANIQVPTWNAIGRFNIWPVNLTSANNLSPPRIMWLKDAPPMIPVNEEYTVKATDTASENCAVLNWLFTPGWTRNLPAADITIPVRCTSTITQVSAGWSALGTLTFEQSLRGGVYSVIGAQVQGSGTIAFRLVFPRARYYHGRKLRPGFLCSQAIGDLPELYWYDQPFAFGEWGRFHTFEPPQMEVFSFGTSSTAHEIRLWLRYLGQGGTDALDSWVSQGWN